MIQLYGNKRYIMVTTYTASNLLKNGERPTHSDETPLMRCAIDRIWLWHEMADDLPHGVGLEKFIENEATYDTFETEAIRAMAKGKCAFAIYEDENFDEHIWFPASMDRGEVADAMLAYHEYMSEETIFEHICRKVRATPFSAVKPARNLFMEDGKNHLIFNETSPTQYAGGLGVEQAFIDILRRCGETILKDNDTGYLTLGPVLADMKTQKEKEPKKAALSLNELYKNDLMWYWCNETGDINVPGAALAHYGTTDDMPPAIQELFTEFWDKNSGVLKYVAVVNGVPGIALGLRFDRDYYKELAADYVIASDIPNETLYKKGTTAVIAVAADIANLIPFGDVYFGEGTDPDGDEIVVFVPGTECREYLDKVVETVCSFTYPTFRKYFTKALYTNHN